MSKHIVAEFEPGERLDKTLARLYPEYSRSSIEKLIEVGNILVNDKSVKTKYTLRSGDVITVDFTDLDRQPDLISLPIIYEDDDVVVINKPINILAHTKGTFSKEATAASFLKPMLKGTDEWITNNRAGIVHRLDRGTSGVMILAKTESAQKFLQKQFAKRNVKKTYLAVVANELPESEGIIDVPIERNPKKPATFRAGANGKSAQTEFKVLHVTSGHSLVELKPHTGRTHQLRVHLAYLKHPIVGDEFYNGEPAARLLLHAAKLEITLPNSERKIFEAPTPAEFKEFVA